MNKNDVASIRKEFKLDNSRLKLADVVSIYVKGDNKQIIGTEKENFGRMAKSDKNQNLHGQLQKRAYRLRLFSNVWRQALLII